jgi:hypothetical protein
MELLRYDPHLNIEKLKVIKFLFGLNVIIHAKVRILMPHMLHDVVCYKPNLHPACIPGLGPYYLPIS